MRSVTRDDVMQRYTDVFGAMSEPIRLDMLLRIAEVPELACTVLDETLPIAKSTISYHVKILYQAGLIEVRKEGRYYFYRARREMSDALIPGLLDRVQGARSTRSRKARPRVLAAV
jgi:DNA-binding transcriptional ArsR family regulator